MREYYNMENSLKNGPELKDTEKPYVDRIPVESSLEYTYSDKYIFFNKLKCVS